MNPRSSPVEGLYAAALWLVEANRPEDALYLFRAILLAAPDDERGWLGLGICHETLGQTSIALELYATATLAGRALRCRVARARLLRQLGHDDEAQSVLDAAESFVDDADDEIAALIAAERRAA